MSSVVNVAIHTSQSPENVRRNLLDSLRQRQINHKFHYDSYKQSQKWLALHDAYSPSRNDTDCADTYDRSFESAAQRFHSPVHLIGLGCGGGQKDARLLGLLQKSTPHLTYIPCDVSLALVLIARKAALDLIPGLQCHPLVCDLASTDDLTALFEKNDKTARLFSFFGMIPNFEPSAILPRLAGMLERSDWLLFSANLAPGPDYEAGVKRILPGYDNFLTRDWLMTFLFDLGVESINGETHFSIQQGEENLRKIVAEFEFSKERTLTIDSESFSFRPKDKIRLFYSYRYTPALARDILNKYGLNVVDQWITKSEEEGVFLCQKQEA